MVRKERAENSRRISYCETYPKMITLLGIDRMNAIRIPWQKPFPKSWMTKYRLRYEVISLIDFGHFSHELYHGLTNYPHDFNTTFTLFYFKLRELKKKNQCTPTLQIHMDNCFCENKNRYVFAFCCILVHFHWFEEINLFFLP